MQLADRFRAYAVAAEAEGSPVYAEWARGVAGDDDVLRVVEAAPEARRQPVLVLATWYYFPPRFKRRADEPVA